MHNKTPINRFRRFFLATKQYVAIGFQLATVIYYLIGLVIALGVALGIVALPVIGLYAAIFDPSTWSPGMKDFIGTALCLPFFCGFVYYSIGVAIFRSWRAPFLEFVLRAQRNTYVIFCCLGLLNTACFICLRLASERAWIPPGWYDACVVPAQILFVAVGIGLLFMRQWVGKKIIAAAVTKLWGQQEALHALASKNQDVREAGRSWIIARLRRLSNADLVDLLSDADVALVAAAMEELAQRGDPPAPPPMGLLASHLLAQ